jgi:DNA polymerase III subunit delta
MSAKPSPVRVIVLSGEEYQRLDRLREVVEAAVDPSTRDFNYDILRTADVMPQKQMELAIRFADLAMTFPMMAERRVVVFRDFDSLQKEVQKKISLVLADAPDSTLAVIEGEKAKLSPAPKQGVANESFKRVYERDLPNWIKQRFRARGRTVADDAIALLINNAGIELPELDSEIEKITIASGEEMRINAELTERVVGVFKRDTVYGLANAVGSGEFAEAARILRNLMDTEKNKETYYTSTLLSHILKLADYNRRVGEGEPAEEAMKTVTASPFIWKLNHMDKQVRNFNPRMIRRALMTLVRTESQLKKSGMDNRLLMELMLPFVTPTSAASARKA